MKTKILYSFIASVFFALMVGIAVAQVTPLDPVSTAAAFFTVRTIYFFTVEFNLTGFLLAGVNKEIWIDKLKESFYSPYPWLEGVDDWSEWVEFNTINLTVTGADPVILKNNVTWPIVAAQRTDTNGTIVLDTYDSTTTRVRNVEEIEASINKLESVVRQHRRSLLQEIVTECLWNYAPATLAAGAMAATGANRTAVIGTQSTVAARMAIDDIAELQTRMDNLDFPMEGRVLVLSPYHRQDLLKEDKSLFKNFTSIKGSVPPLYGFDDVYVAKNTPLFTKTTYAKKAYGAAADNTNDCVASVAFIKSEVMKCDGDLEMFFKPKGINPEQRADEVGFQKRFKGVPQRSVNFLTQAIVSGRA